MTIDLVYPLGILVMGFWIFEIWPRLRSWLFRQPPRRPPLLRGLLFLAAFFTVWQLYARGVIPEWVNDIAIVGLNAALWLPDDDDDHRPRRRFRRALKAAKRYLAVGIPARRPVTEGA